MCLYLKGVLLAIAQEFYADGVAMVSSRRWCAGVENGTKTGAMVDLTSHFEGETLTAPKWRVVEYDIPSGNIATYFPEANCLIPLNSVAKGSNTPTSKSVCVTVQPTVQNMRFWNSKATQAA